MLICLVGLIEKKDPVVDFIIPKPLLPQENAFVAFEKMWRPHCEKTDRLFLT